MITLSPPLSNSVICPALTSETVATVYLHLNLETIAICSRVSKLWYQATHQNSLWKALCESDLSSELQTCKIDQSTDYRALYKFFYIRRFKEMKKNLFLVGDTSSVSSIRPAYVVNIPLKVDSDDEGETSSDEELDQTFPQGAFQEPSNYFRLLSKDSGTKKDVPRGQIVDPPILPEKNSQPQKNKHLFFLLMLFEEEASRLNSPTSSNRLGISVGFNKMRSLSQRRNDSLKRRLNESLDSCMPVYKMGFFWDGVWQERAGGFWRNTTYDRVRCFYRQLKRSNCTLAKKFRQTAEKNRGHMVPYREIRDTIKNHLQTKRLIQIFREAMRNRDIYIVFLDSDIRSFHHTRGSPGAFAVFDENYLSSRFEICSTGYTIEEPDKTVLEIGVLADLAVRNATAKHIRRGVYYPEPCTAVKVPTEHETIPENFSDPRNRNYLSPQEMPRLIAKVVERRNLDAQRAMVFDSRGAIVTTLPERMKREFRCFLTHRNGIIFWGFADFQTMRDINQSHYNPRDWALNLLPALRIRSSLLGEYTLKDKKVIRDVLISLLSRLFNAFDPIELAQRASRQSQRSFQKCLIETLTKYENALTDEIPTTEDRRSEKISRKNARDEELALRKCQAVNTLWQRADRLSTVPSLLQLIGELLEQDVSQSLRAAAQESGSSVAELFKSKLCLNYEELIIDALAKLLGKNKEEIQEQIPQFYLNIINGISFTSAKLKQEIMKINNDHFYGVSPLHIAALAGNLEVIRELMKYDSETFIASLQDNGSKIPLQYALTHCCYNGLNLDLVVTLCDDEILDEVQEIVGEELDDISDRMEVLDQLLKTFSSKFILADDGAVFIEAILNNRIALAEALSEYGEYSTELYNAILDLAPEVDDRLIQWARTMSDGIISDVIEDLGESEAVLFRINLGESSSDYSSGSEYEDCNSSE